MTTIQELNDFINNPELTDSIAQVWALIGKHFEQAQSTLPAERAMPRKELSFHDHVRLAVGLSGASGRGRPRGRGRDRRLEGQVAGIDE